MFTTSPSLRALGRIVFFLVLSGICIAMALWPSANAQSNTQGQWSSVQQWGLRAVHMALLPTGKVIFWSHYSESLTPQIWDPATNNVTPANTVSYEIFCGGHAFLANGQLLVSGGAITTNLGVPNLSFYDPIAGTWTAMPAMNAGRWYPTSTTLANGDVLTISGNDEHGNPNLLPQVWSNATQSWISLTSAQLNLQLYPRDFLAPNGQVFMAGQNVTTRYLNTTGTGSWTVVGNQNYTAGRSYGPAVMYDYGKIIYIGGGDPPTNTAELIDLTASTPAWTYTNSMAYARRNSNATLLPDGTILVTGGSSGSGFDNSTAPVYPAELWDPATQQWTTLASFTAYRGYHSTALLLPDGRVVSAGGEGGGPTAEIYSPPYLFNGPQPVISSSPPTVTYGQKFFVGTPNSTSISQVNMLRLGAVTHAFNQSQRISKLTFTQTSAGLTVTAPPDGIHCPPGYYMLFIINNIGVPSVASMIQIGTPPAATASPTSLSFGSQQIGTSSSPQTAGLTVTYSGSSQLYAPNNISTTGDFSQTNNCGGTMIAGTTCSITVTFTPTAAGTRTGTLTITDNSTSGSQAVSLTGTATGPTVSLSPTSLAFGAQTQGVPSAPQTVTLTNTGTDILTISSITTTGPNAADFAQTNTCGTLPASIAAGANCAISVTFTPSITGSESASLSIADNAPGNPHAARLGGQGGPPAPLVTLSATSLAYGNQNVGASAAQAINLQNTGSATLSITSITFTGTNKGDFSQTNSCGSSQAPGASCTVNVTFTPAATGARTATLNFNDNATGSPQTVSLTGAGTTPGISLSPGSLSFGNQLINADSAAQNVTLTNTGTGTLTINSITSTGNNGSDFIQANTCGASVAASTTCTISVTFDPPVTGSRTGSLSISDNAAGSPHTIALSGTGVTPVASLSTTSVSFGNQNVGTTSATQSVTLTNTGTMAMTISNISVSGTNGVDFAQTNTCGTLPATVAIGANCTLSVTYTPTVSVAESASISIFDNAAPSPQTITLTGTGTTPAVTLSTASLAFGNQDVATASTVQTITLTSSGTGTLTITSIALGGTNPADFGETNTCGTTVNAGANCAISVTFAPTTTGARSASLSITDNASGSPQTITLSGTGVTPSTSLSTTSLTFSSQQVNTPSTAQTVTLTNPGTGPLNIASIAITGTNNADFSQTNTCGTSVAPSANCTISVTFNPTTTGARTASVSIADNAAGSPQTVSLTGTGVAPAPNFLPASLTFSAQQTGTTSAAQTVTLTNAGSGTLTISSLTITGTNSGDFAQTNTCGSSVAANASCTITVTFAPTGTGTRSASVSVSDNATGSPQTIGLTGTGTAPAVSLSTASAPFGNQFVGTTSASQSVTLQNTGTAPLTIASIVINGTNSAEFAQTNTCGSVVAAGASCTFTLTFTPSATHARVATLGITDNAAGSPQTVALSGNGTGNAVPQVNAPVVPASVTPGASGFTLTVNGTGFVSGSVVTWNGSARPTQFVSSTQLTATIQASDVATAGTASVGVTSPTPAGGTSIPAFFEITHSPSAIFVARSDVSTGASPRSVIAADFNGDGKLDLATANAFDNTVSILLGNGDGTLQSRKDYNTGSSPVAVAVGDFNGDGALDLAVVNQQSNTVSILLGNGNGTFQAHTDYNTASSPSSIVVGDFNGDGALDLAVANSGSNTVSVLLGNGDGTFKARVDYNTGASPNSIVAGDFNGDGLLDLAVANSGGNTVSILLGNGDGTFQSHQDFATGANPMSVTTADFNGDGKLDLAVANSNDSTVSILLGKGNGAFLGHIDYATGNAPNSVMAGDFNGDGVLDLAVTNGIDNTVSVLLGNGNGTFQTHQDFATGAKPQCVIAGDFNRDGALDLAVAGQNSNSVSVLLESVAGASPASVSFTNQQVGTTSASQTVTVQNGGSGPLTISNIAVAGANSGDFGQTNNCGSSIAAGGNCAITVTFSPTAIGARSATLTISDAAVGSPQIVNLAGTGIAPVVSLSATSIPFGNQLIPTTSSAQTVTLQNTGGAALAISSIAVTGANNADFAQTNTCGSNVAPSASCAITVTFTPSINGVESAAVTITDNALDSPESITLTGTGTSPTVSLSPTSVVFSNQLVGITSAAQTVTLQNTGTGPLNITSIAVTGTNNADFAQTNTCGSSVAAGKSCSISITFTPSINGGESASITITDNAGGSPESVSLGGTGVTPAVNLSTASLTFASQQVSTSSTSQQVTLQNTGTGPLNITSMMMTGTNGGDFSQSNTCGSSVTAGASCNINVTFTPTATGSRNATLNLNDNASGSPQTVGLTGTGIAPVVSLSAASVSFGSQQVGTSSAAQTVTLQNTGTAPLNITSFTVTGTNNSDFSQTNTCGSSVTNGASCTISVTFTPTAAGNRSANVSIADNASGSPQTVGLTGTGIAPVVSLSASSVPFGNQQVGTTSGGQTVTLQNTGAAPLTINSISVTGTNSGDFAQTNSCGSSVAVGASCTISVTFTPSAAGARSAAITLSDNAGSGTQTIGLTGTGVVPVASLSPASLMFPAQLIGSPSAAQAVTLQNAGGAPLAITSITITGTNSGDFAQTNACGSSLAAGTSCIISVTFTPAASGTRTAAISVTDNASGSPQSVSLTGTGATGAPAVTLSLTSIAFPSRLIGTTSLPKNVTLKNNGTSTLTLAGITITGTSPGDFAETNTCGTSVNAGASCTISVTFAPTTNGTRSAAVSIADNASGSPQAIALSGTGLAASTVTLTPATLSFPKQVVGTTSTVQTITLKNTGNGTVSISSIIIAGTNSTEFAKTSSCGATLAVGASCTISVTFTPLGAGTRSASVTITDNAAGTPQNVTLAGAGTFVAVTPTALSFPAQTVATTSSAQTVTVKNTATTALSITGITIGGTDPGDFSQTNTCGTSLAAGATCTLSVTFTPKAKGARSATSSITDSDPASPQSLTLTGTGQ